MKNKFKYYTICWTVLLAVFNVVCFVTQSETAGMSKFGGAFWTGYVFITLAFLGQLACAYKAFQAENLKKFFYNIPLITVSYSALIIMAVAGSICMAIPGLPNWVGIVVCFTVLAFSAISVLKAGAAAQMVEEVDRKVTAQTQTIRMLTMEAENLMNSAKSPEIKAECKKVYEALRYSDPMSSEALRELDQRIEIEFNGFKRTVLDGVQTGMEIRAGKIVAYVEERAQKVKFEK